MKLLNGPLAHRFGGLLKREGPNGKKQLTQMVHSGQSGLFSVGQLLPATKIDYAAKVGDGLRSSVLAAPFNWIARNFPQAPPVVDQIEENEQWERVPRHPMIELLRRPNDFYSGHTMFMALSVDIAWGNAYLLKIRNLADDVIQLWYVPRGDLIAKWPRDGSEYISHYEYTVGGMRQKDILPRNVIHFRFGLDPRDPRMGLTQIGALMREVYTDDEAANFSSAILKNMGIIGTLIAPKEGGSAKKEDLKEVRNYLQEAFTGDERAKFMILGSPTDVNVMQYNMQGFDVSPIRDIAEERVCASLGIAAAVVGFGTGLQQTKVGATMKEMRKASWEDGIIPLQQAMAEDLEQQLLPDFQEDTSTTRVLFDTSAVAALQEEEEVKHEKIRKDVAAGILKVSQGQALLGYPVDPDREVYLQPVNIIQLPDGVVPAPASEEP